MSTLQSLVVPKSKLALAITLLFALALAVMSTRPSYAEDGFVIKSFGTRYAIQEDTSIEVTEDLLVDFTATDRHGIFRDIPVLFKSDTGPDRVYRIKVRTVTDGQRELKYETSRDGPMLRIKIGDPDRFVTGLQRYVITYKLEGALNSFDDHEELYWNITGTWGVPIERASAVVTAPEITGVRCFQGYERSSETCGTGISPSRADYETTRVLQPGEELTIVTALAKGSIAVPVPIKAKSTGEKIRDFLGLKPVPVAAALFVGLAVFGALGRLWWLQGRDRWYGDVQYLSGSEVEDEKPLGAKETVVVEYTPPEIGRNDRTLRPAEIGVLMDERADTLDVSATIVDLAVRGYLRITEEDERKYSLTRLREPDQDLLPYEASLLTALFKGTYGTVQLDDLKDHFYGDLARVKSQLYRSSVKDNKVFPTNPETVRTIYRVGGLVVAGAGAGAIFLGGLAGAGVIGIPIVLAGLAGATLAGLMPRRTARGRELYRRARGFREYMVTAETDRAKFAEEIGLFEKYLPYAIVFRCTDKWAKAFEGLEREPGTTTWYSSPHPFVVSSFVSNIGSFSSSVASVMASTPSSSGSSGFGGGGGAGGGGGGGGGGSW